MQQLQHHMHLFHIFSHQSAKPDCAEINPINSIPVGILAYTPLFEVNNLESGGQTGDGDGIGETVFNHLHFLLFDY
jgi:hypothetical protein